MSLFVAGKSGNVNGRPKHSVRSVKGMVERFVTRNITPTKLQRMFNGLTVHQQIDMLLQLLPYAVAKQSAETLSKEEIERLYQMVEDKMKDHGKAV
jgi:hypothetical protein